MAKHIKIERGNVDVILNEKTDTYIQEKEKYEEKALHEKKIFWYIITFIASIVAVLLATAMKNFGIFLFAECITQIGIFVFMDITMDKLPESLQLSHKLDTLNIYAIHIMCFEGTDDKINAKYEITYAKENGNRSKFSGLIKDVKYDENISCQTLDLREDFPILIKKN